MFGIDDLIGGALAVGGKALGSFVDGSIGHYFDKKSASQANAYNVYNYQHRYQWQVEDMRRAGLNPILAATQGAGAVPATSVGTSGASAGISSGNSSFASMFKDIYGKVREKATADVNKSKADADLSREQINTERTKQDVMRGEADVNSAEAVIRRANAERAQELFSLRVMAERARAMGDLSEADMKLVERYVKAAEAHILYGFNPSEIGFFGDDPAKSRPEIPRSKRLDDILDTFYREGKRYQRPDSPTIHWFMRHYGVDAKGAASILGNLPLPYNLLKGLKFGK